MQRIVNAAPTPGEGARAAGDDLGAGHGRDRRRVPASPRLKDVHWQAGDRPAAPAPVSVAGESALFVDPADIPAGADVARLGQALARAARRPG